jgi:hypothetical protein
MCSHAFPYWSVIPPSRCPLCGSSLQVTPYMTPYPVWPVVPPLPYYPPYYVTVTTNTSSPAPRV